MTTRRDTLRNDAFELTVLPERGASLARLSWRRPDGAWVELMRRPDESHIDDLTMSLSTLSSFIMAPFANRIDAAAFDYDGARHALPMNRPQQNCAIHGLSRDHAWTVLEATSQSHLAEDLVERPGSPFHYRLRQTLRLRPDQAQLMLEIQNLGAAPMPFGFGLHPWFPRDGATRLSFTATTTFDGDERTFPIAARAVDAETRFDPGVRVADRLGMDRGFAGWRGVARIEQPSQGVALNIEALGAFTHLHIFCPTDQELFCVEPVSHVADVVNRRAFAEYGDMARLDPGQRLTGAVAFRPSALAT